MMKLTKIFVLVAVMIGAMALVACKGKNKSGETSSMAIDSLKGRRVLVVYFSRAGENYLVGNVKKGNTKFLAEYIAEMTRADIYEIKAMKNYDLSYKEMLDVVREETENGEIPEFKCDLKDVSCYDIVFVGGPIWWGTYPRLMLSFFNKYDLNGKILIPFTTNEGSGLGNTRIDLQKAYPKATVLDGFSMSGQEARKPEARIAVEEWLSCFSYDSNDEYENEKLNVDGVTGATTSKELPKTGKKIVENQTMKVNVKYSDGKEKNVELTVQGVVDMGSGVKWNAVNLGAESPWEVGNHYAWGETEPKKSYTEKNYAYMNKNIGDDINATWYDAAHRLLGNGWRMPTHEEWHTLLVTSEHDRVSIQGRQGYLFTAKNGSLLFFPANGYIYDTEVGTPDEGYYWSSTNSSTVNAYVTYLPTNSWGQSNYGRHIGIGIRAVK